MTIGEVSASAGRARVEAPAAAKDPAANRRRVIFIYFAPNILGRRGFVALSPRSLGRIAAHAW
jgi:hypothetical protein